MFEDDSADEPRQEAELDPSGEMRNTLDQIFEGGSQSHKEPKASNQDAESSTAHLVERAGSCKKRDWDSFVGVATKSSKDEAEDSPSTFCPSPKRQRNSQDVELQAFIRPNRVIDENYDDHTDNESEGNASPPTIRASPDLSCASQTAVQRQERAGDSQGLLDQNPHSANSDIKKAGVQLKDTKSRGTKRPRDSSADIVAEGSAEERCPPQAKRPRLEIDTLDDHDLTDSDYQSDVDVESDTTNSDDGSNIEDTLIDNQESVPGGTEDKTRLTFQQTQEDGKRLVRPTFFGIRSWWNKDTKKLVRFTDDNESGDWVVTGMRQGQLGAYASILGSSNGVEPGNRSWTAEEEETLRFWVQDNGIQRWDVIAWCLRRREQECREQYTDIVVLRNKQAGRDPHAGLPGWEDPELAPTPEELAEEDARKAARREAAKEAREAEAAKEAGKAANQEPNTTVRSEPEPWPEVQGEEPEFLYEVPVKVDEEEEAPAGLQVPAPTTLPAESEKIPSSRLRTRKAKTSVKVGNFGLICYDPKAKAFPRVTQTGALVDSKGELLSTNEQEGGGSGGNQESSSGGGASDLEDIGGNSDQTGGNGSDTGADHRIGRYRHRVMQGRITKRPGCGARRGIDRRAGHRRK